LELCWHKNPTCRPSFKDIIVTIEDIMIECAIKDEEGRVFWKENFKGKEHVAFDQFLPLFLTKHKLPTPTTVELECFKLLAVTKYTDNIMQPFDAVRIADFGKVLENFGPISLTIQRSGKKDKVITLFSRIAATCKQPWFHGDITTPQAQQLLQVHGPGYYLVRLSSSKSGCFTISRVTKQKSISHHRVDYRGNQTFVTHAVGNPKREIRGENVSLRSFIKTLKEDMHLVNACPGSKFRVLFKIAVATTNTDDDGYGLGVGEFIDDD